MANPDTKPSSANADGFLTSLPVALFFLLVTAFIFQFRDSIPSFTISLWVIMIILTFSIITCVNLTTQYIECNKTNAGRAMLGSLVSVAGVLIALTISSISYCRIPVASVFAPLFIGKTVDITSGKSSPSNMNSLKNTSVKECCVPKLTLEGAEKQLPLVAGLSYGFYIMFGILFGSVIGSGISSIC